MSVYPVSVLSQLLYFLCKSPLACSSWPECRQHWGLDGTRIWPVLNALCHVHAVLQDWGSAETCDDTGEINSDLQRVPELLDGQE